MTPGEALLLTRRDVAAMLDLPACVAAVEEAFRLHGAGKTSAPGILGFPYPGGGFHIKAAGLDLSRRYFAVKTNGNYSGNPDRFGLPAIQGVIVLCDGENGSPLALLDSIEITVARTGAATAVAARHLARKGAKVATICGCGNQGRVQLRALALVRPLVRAYVFDLDTARAARFAEELSGELHIDVRATRDLRSALSESDICVTCTPSRRFFVALEDVRAGTFVAAVGADSPEKQEIDPRLVASSKLVTDIRAQCASIGELHHALAEGLMSMENVHAELGEIVAGTKPGRESDSETIVFDSTGTALQDVAAAAVVYEKAIAAGAGLRVALGK
ncbi:MAG TPA: ornithine cyclodeaminase family protein [Thermoanaerobaculia bacterium]|nr:ornithine cyclodeaminase family protein [Thermoanaerobaculia bacterium]